LPSRLAASSEKIAVDVGVALSFPSPLECLPATASYSETEWPTSRKRRAVSASKAIFCAKATRTTSEGSVIICATFLKTYRGNIDASEGGNVVTTEERDS